METEEEERYYYALGRLVAVRQGEDLYHVVVDQQGNPGLMMDEQGSVVRQHLYLWQGDSYVDSDSPRGYQDQYLASYAQLDLYHLGAGRFFALDLNHPLQPNPLGGPPTLPQALNRYAPTPWGAPGVAQGANPLAVSPSAWLGVAGNATLEILGRTVFLKQPHLALQGSALAVKQGLAGLAAKGVPFDVTVAGTKGGKWGELGLGLSGRIPLIGGRVQGELAERLVILEAATTWPASRLTRGRLLFEGVGELQPTSVGLKTTRYQAGLLLRQSRLASAAASMGQTLVVDVGVEAFGAATGSGRWGNPYWTAGQKVRQAGLVVFSDVALAGGLVLVGAAWYVTIPVAFFWAITADPVFARFPVTAPLYNENRNLRPLP